MKKLNIIWILWFGLILRILNIGKNLSTDSAMSLAFSQNSLSEIWKIALLDPHPPTYIYFLHFLQYISSNIIFLKLVFIIIGMLSIYTVYLIAKKLYSEKIGLIAALLLCINPLHIEFSLEFRMYILICLTLCLAFYYFIQERYLLFTLFAVISIYIEYFAVMPLIAIGLIGLFRNHKKMILSGFFTAILISPLFNLINSSKGAFTILPHSLTWKLLIIPKTLANFIFGNISIFFDYYSNYPLPGIYTGMLTLLFVLIFVWILFAFSFKQIQLYTLIFIPLMIPLILDFFVPVQIDAKRYLFVLCIFCIVLANMIESFNNIKYNISHKIIILLFCAIYIISLIHIYSFDYQDFKGASEIVFKDDIVFVGTQLEAYNFDYYYDGNFVIIPYPINWSDKSPNNSWSNKSLYNEHVINYNYTKYINQNIWFIEVTKDGSAKAQAELIKRMLNDYDLKSNQSLNGLNILYMEAKK